MSADLATDDAFGSSDAFELMSGGDIDDPYPDLALMRHTEPVAEQHLTPVQVGAGEVPIFTVYRYADVDRVLRDAETFTSSGYGAVTGPVMGRTILEMDPPEHTAHRELVAYAFRKRALAEWQAAVITPKAHELIDGFAGRGFAELMGELAVPYPVQVIAAMLGLPAVDYEQFLRWAMALISWPADLDAGMAASKALTDYFSTILAERRVSPKTDLISGLATAELDGQRLSDDDIFGFLRLLLPAGAETTARSFGNLMAGLLAHPEQFAALRADRGLVKQAIEEGIRWEPPLLFIQRTATRATMVGGVEVPEGAILSLCLGSANRDETRFDRPDEFDITRPVGPHLAFGAGPHMCLGQQLARLEIASALEACLDRLPSLRVDPAAGPPQIKGLVFRSPPRLDVLFDHHE